MLYRTAHPEIEIERKYLAGQGAFLDDNRQTWASRSRLVMTVLIAMLSLGQVIQMAIAKPPLVKMQIVKAKNPMDFDKYRKILVSPTVNTPKPFQGFGGFCGWPKICRLQNGDLYVTFSAGYWHASWPAPFEKYGQPPKYAQELYKRYPWLGKWESPTGGKMMWIRSKDNGKTWSRPRTFPIIPGAYAVGDVIQTRDGNMYGAALIQLGYGYRARMPTKPLEYGRIVAKLSAIQSDWTVVFQSQDNGESWHEISRFPGPFQFMASPQTLLESANGTLLMLTEGVPWPQGEQWPETKWISTILESGDRGTTWKVISVFGSNEFGVEEGSLAYLPDGSIGMGSRTSSAWFQSYDDGKTWLEPRLLHEGSGRLFKKGDLVVTPDGVAVLVYCGGPGGSGEVIYSRDSGKTWIKPAKDRGFKFDPISYYPDACVLDDGSIFVVGDNQGFKNKYGPYGSRSVAMRFRIKTPEEGEGIELLRIGGRRLHRRDIHSKPTTRAADEADRALEGQ